VARALVAEPSLLILDEPSAGLSPKVAAELFARLRALNTAGVTAMLVEQNVRAALAVAGRAIILVEGQVCHQGPAASLADDPIVAEFYLGGPGPREPAR
jgi:branched-chain amino acid transport system ATP-binding protein